MKNLFFLFFSIILFSCGGNQQQNESTDTTSQSMNEPVVGEVSLEESWQTDTVMITPESVLYDQQRNIIYIANINGDPRDQDGNGFISKLNSDGSVAELKWVTGLDAPKGMGVHENSLYVTDINQIVEINISEGNVSNRYPVPGAQFLNDITVSPDGVVYFTDSDGGKIQKLEEGEVSDYLTEGLERPNGLFYEDNRLLLASSGDGTVKAIDHDTQEVSILAEGIGHGDGIVPAGNGNYLVSNWQGEIWFLNSNWETTKLLDTKDQEINTADIDYIITDNLLLIPTFFDNRILGYSLNVPTSM